MSIEPRFGVYIHIPYCLQRCHYCDFATFEQHQTIASIDYIQLVLRELRQRSSDIGPRPLHSVYFGGGTPSLISPLQIVAVLNELANLGFGISTNTEVTIEINPATISKEKLEIYLAGGVNRFSVGAQSFNDRLLKLCGRRHSSQDTRETIDLLKQRNLNFSLDLLFALPTQTPAELDQDLEIFKSFSPPHMSPYCLTVPSGHPMNQGRAPEEEQVEMFTSIELELGRAEILRYEISNFAKPGYESRHNMLYWSDCEYWGVGLSSHSYLRLGRWGVRFFNPNTMTAYQKSLDETCEPMTGDKGHFALRLPDSQKEVLQVHEALTDFCHMHLRTTRGLHLGDAEQKFGPQLTRLIERRLEKLQTRGLVDSEPQRARLNRHGLLLSNLVFRELTFLRIDIPRDTPILKLNLARS